MRFHIFTDLVWTQISPWQQQRGSGWCSVCSGSRKYWIWSDPSPCKDWYHRIYMSWAPGPSGGNIELSGDKLDRELMSSLCSGYQRGYFDVLSKVFCVWQLVPILLWQDFSLGGVKHFGNHNRSFANVWDQPSHNAEKCRNGFYFVNLLR